MELLLAYGEYIAIAFVLGFAILLVCIPAICRVGQTDGPQFLRSQQMGQYPPIATPCAVPPLMSTNMKPVAG